MKSSWRQYLVVPILCALFASCSFAIPEKVEVKATPTVNAALGSTSFKISEYLATDDIAKMFDSSSSMKVYAFKDPAEADILKYVVHYPITSMELDFQKYLDGMDLTGSIEQSLSEQSFAIPSVSNSASNDVTVNLNSVVVEAVNGAFTPLSAYILEGVGGANQTLPSLSIALSSVDRLKFSAGSFDFACEISGATPGFEATITKIELQTTGGEIRASTTTATNAINGTASLSLAGATLEKNMRLVITFSALGGTIGQPDTLHITPRLSSDCAISDAEGVSVTTTVAIPSSTIPMAAGDTFVSATVGVGSVSVTQNLNAGTMSGFTQTLHLSASQSGGLGFTDNQSIVNGIPSVFNLSGESLSRSNITVSGSMTITATNGSFTDMPASGFSMHVGTETKIDQFSQVVVRPGDTFKTTQNLSENLPETMKNWVDAITFSKIGVSVTFVNTLPTGNNMTLDVDSTALAFNGTPQTLLSNATTTAEFANSGGLTLDPQTVNAIDLAVYLTPQAYNETTKQLTLYNITAGSTISFSGSVKFIADWSSALITPNTPVAGSFPENDGIDLSPIKEYLGDNIEFSSLPMYLYVVGPTLQSGAMSFSASVDAMYTPSGATAKTTANLLTSTGVSLVSALPTMPSSTSDAFTVAIPSASAQMDFAPALNAKASDLTIKYSLTPNTIIVTPNDLKGVGGSTITAEMLLVLPFKMRAKAGAVITFDDKPFDSKTDLLGREKGASSSNDNLDIALESLDSLNLTIGLTNSTGLTGEAKLTDKSGANDTDYFEKTFSLDKSSQTLSLKKSDVAYIRRVNPFTPIVTFTVPEGDFAIRQTGGIDITLSVSAATNVDHTFTLGGN